MRWFLAAWVCVSTVRAASLSHDAYIWQRAWDEPVVAAITAARAQLHQFDILAAEARWHDGRFEVTRINPDYAALRHADIPVGLALRIGVFPQNDTNAIATMSNLATALVREARANQLSPAEVQVDFDCPENKLDLYRAWLGSLRRAIAPVPLTITTLPCWLRHTDAFQRLVTDTDGFVLQVHSLERPKSAVDSFTICDPAEARRAAAAAGGFGRPFRIALPTYGYVISFDSHGRFAGFSAEGLSLLWPEGSVQREVRANPAAMAELVREWTTAPPARCSGIIWYRLPCASDQLNWQWVTLAAVMAGKTPQARLVFATQRQDVGLVELTLANTGDADAFEPRSLVIRWRKGQLLSSDALGGFDKHADGTNAVVFTGSPHLIPGQTRTIGWLRFRDRQERELETEIH